MTVVRRSSSAGHRSARRAFIVRYGIVRAGLPLGLAAFCWVAVTQFGTTLDRLHTSAGWIRLAVLFVVSFGEWTLGAGILLGALFWSLRRDANRKGGSSNRSRRT